jgi:N-acetylornithine carbamoyltransferase
MWNLEYKENVVMDGKNVEHVKDASKVLSRYFDAICVRSFPALQNWEEEKGDPVINCFAKYSDVPVINMESNLFHPLQALADIMTIKEKLGDPKNKKFVLTWIYHPKALPMAVPNSAALIASQFGMDVSIANPKDFDLSEDITRIVKKNCESNSSKYTTYDNMEEAFKGADIIYAKEWGSPKYYGNLETEKAIREQLKDWIVDSNKMKLTNNARLMHCLPVRRNVGVTDEVLDSNNSVIYDEAENRLHSQKGLLKFLLGR